MQYLHNISEKEVKNGGYCWHADIRQSFYKLVLSFLMEVARDVQYIQIRKLVIFFQFIKKNYRNCFVLYCDAKHSDVLRGSNHVRCYLFCNIWVMFSNISRIYFFFLSIQNINSNCYIIFLNFFPIIIFWWKIFSYLPFIFIFKKFNFSYSSACFPIFFMT